MKRGVDCERWAPMIGSRPGELTAEESRGLEVHLGGCERCSALAADVAATEGLVSEALLARAAQRDFAPFVDQVMARVAPPAKVGILEWLRGHRRALALLAPGLAAAALVVYLSSSGGDRQDFASLEVASEGEATTVIQTAEGPIVLLAPEDAT
jgi:anti-sigma factor RsiW